MVGYTLGLIYAFELEFHILQICLELNQILYNWLFFFKGQMPQPAQGIQIQQQRYNQNENSQPQQIPPQQLQQNPVQQNIYQQKRERKPLLYKDPNTGQPVYLQNATSNTGLFIKSLGCSLLK